VKKSLLMPAVFIIWGLEKVIADFAFPIPSLGIYVACAAVGTGVGYLLYSKKLK
jgi:hypothetical protein